jgi:hypothetical protein
LIGELSTKVSRKKKRGKSFSENAKILSTIFEKQETREEEYWVS